MNRIQLLSEVTKMLQDFRDYFAYLQGKNESSKIDMPEAAITVWINAYEQLTPEERENGKRGVYEHYHFHPSVDQFRQLARGSEEGRALKEWIIILDALRMSKSDAYITIQSLSSQGRKALRTVGSLTGLSQCPEASLHKSVKEDFCKAWVMIKSASTPHPLEEVASVDAVNVSGEFQRLAATLMHEL